MILLALLALASASPDVESSTATLQAKADVCNSGIGPGALATCNELIQAHLLAPPDLATIFYSRGTIRLASKEYTPAIEDYSEAIRLVPDFAAAIINRAAAYVETDQYQKAIADCDRYILLNPDLPKGYGIRSAAYLSVDLYEKAINDFDRAISLDSKPPASLFAGRGFAREKMGQFSDALSDFDTAMQLDPRNRIFLVEACWLRAATNRELGKAQKFCQSAMGLSQNNADSYASTGFVFFRLADFSGAMKALDTAIGLDAHSARAHFLRGVIRKRIDSPGGDADIAAAKAIDPKIAKTYAGYGVTP